LIIIILASCAYNDNYGLSIKKWVGSRETYLIQGWGEPDKTYTKGQSKFYEFYEEGGAPKGCTTTFEIVEEIVKSFKYTGAGCVGDFNTYRYRY